MAKNKVFRLKSLDSKLLKVYMAKNKVVSRKNCWKRKVYWRPGDFCPRTRAA
jgi:hypothetical protein